MVVDYKMDWIKLSKGLDWIFEHEVWLEKYDYWLTKEYLMERRSKKITVYDSVTFEPVDSLSYYKK